MRPHRSVRARRRRLLGARSGAAGSPPGL